MEEVRPIIKVDIGDSQKTVKGLKDEIKMLKDYILNLEKGTGEYNDAVSKLISTQRELDEVMALTKKTATALDGSYDSLVHQMSLLKKEWRATNDEAKRNEIGKQIDDINGKLKEMDASVGNYSRNVGNYVSHWEGMPEITKDFGASMREMNETIEPTKKRFESVSKVASGLASGFAAARGAAVLLGVENEELEKTFAQLQVAIALAQGVGGLSGLVEGVGTAKVAFAELDTGIKAVNKSMGKTGWIAVIMLVVTAITLLVTHLVKKNKAIKDSTSALKEYNKVSKEAQIETLEETHSLKVYNDMATDVSLSMDTRRKAGIELLKSMEMEISETNILAAVNGQLTEKVNLATEAIEKQARAGVLIKQLTELYTEYVKILEKGPNVWDKIAEGWNNPAFAGGGLIGSLIGGALTGDGTDRHLKRAEEALRAYEEFLEIFKEKFGDIFGNDNTEAKTWEQRYQTIANSLKSEEQLLKEQYDKDIALAKKYGSDITVITKKYNEDLKKLREDRQKLEEQNVKTIQQIADADLAHIERVYKRRIAYAEMSAENENDAAKAEYDLTLEKEQEKLLVIQEALDEAYKDEEKNKDLILDLVQDKADQELLIEQIKYNELERLRRENLTKQRNALRLMDSDFRDSLRSLGISSDSSQPKKKRGFFGSIFGQGAVDDYKAQETQDAIDEQYYQDAYAMEQSYLQKKLELNQKFLAETTNAEDRLDLERSIAEIELQIDESKYAEKKRLRDKDTKDEEEKQKKVEAIFTASMNATADLLGGLADMYESDEKNAEKNAAKIKGLRIAEATINTINGAVGAYSQAAATIPPPAGIIVGAVQAAAVTAAGLANIMKIKNTKTDGSSGTSNLGAAVTPTVASYSSELPVTYSRNILGNSEVDELNKSTKVYVLESDIADAMTKVKVRGEESSF